MKRIVLDTLGDFFSVLPGFTGCGQAGAERPAERADLLEFGIAQEPIRSGNGSGRRVLDIIGDPQIPVTHDV